MTLPLFLSVPHAGLWVPPEVEAINILTAEEIADDGDRGAAEIYFDLEAEVAGFVTTKVARAFVDMNRAEDDIRKDGVVKTHTCWDVPIYREPLGRVRTAALIEGYHRPYHELLSQVSEEVMLCVDCHTMAASAPPVAPDPGQPRPDVCLSNGDGTLPDEWFDLLGDCFSSQFKDVRLNDPFSGGYITRQHALERPWVQLELSRTPAISNGDKGRRVLRAFEDWCGRVDRITR